MSRTVIICVDDEPTILDSLKIELKTAFGNQYLIETAEGGEEAIELVEELLEDSYELPLIISDYIMPNIKGDELLKRIHAISPTTLKILLTGQADINAVGNAIQYANLYRYISKPWNTEDLILTISEAVKSYFQEQQIASKNQELEKQVEIFHKFVPAQFLNLLNIKNQDQIKIGTCINKEMTIMFADIRNFTSLSENMTPQENFNFINSYLSQMEPVIDKYHGFIDKYIGDGIMALFPTNVDNAIQAALDMLKVLAEYNLTRGRPQRPVIDIGVGIHTGSLMLGTVGGTNRMDGTVISDAVNLSSRIEGLNKVYNTSILITENTYQQIADISKYNIRIIDRVTVKGKTNAVTIYEVFDVNSTVNYEHKLATLKDFEAGCKYFHQEEFAKAHELFKQVIKINPEDKAAKIYIRNCYNIANMIIPEKFKILIVDDTPLNVNILAIMLSKNKFEVKIAENGSIGVEMAIQQQPHLILLDVMMPGMNGFDTCNLLKSNEQTTDIPIIFMSALSNVDDKVKGFKVGAVDYITKPFQLEEILIRVKTQLNLNLLQNQRLLRNSLNISNSELEAKIENLILNSHI
ncbi:response regulator [Candidatus Halobeggiatoa sp. HSG11]|nr:response regulator [Candidatus Halobeggiatoa sp. HSG11]